MTRPCGPVGRLATSDNPLYVTLASTPLLTPRMAPSSDAASRIAGDVSRAPVRPLLEVPMLPCAVCGDAFPYARACDQVHASLCHWCYEANMSQALGSRAHDPPPAPVPARSLREQAAVSAYLRHVVRTGGPGPRADLVREDTP